MGVWVEGGPLGSALCSGSVIASPALHAVLEDMGPGI
jgi:hypothetical protein